MAPVMPSTIWRLSVCVFVCSIGCREPAGSPSPAAAQPQPRPADARPVTPPVVPTVSAAEYEKNNIAVFRKMAPATVFITQKQLVRDIWSMRQSEVESGTGSGFVWDEKGHIVTNFHVVANGNSFLVTLFDGTALAARFVGGDPNKDVAVLKIDVAKAKVLTPVVLPPSGHKLVVGQTAIAIGNPFGLDHTLTVGVVSALGREMRGYGGVTIRNMVQTDASINPGNSGGPLLDRQGHLLGMNTMIYSKAGQSAGIGFAVPTTTLARVVPQIITYGKPRRVGLGISIVPDSLARRSGITGVVISEVIAGGPAARAGLRGLRNTARGTLVGDVIVAVAGASVEDYDDLYNALDGREPAQEIEVTLLRDGTRETVKVVLALVQ